MLTINEFLESPISDYKNVNISMEVSFLEKQYWYYKDHLEKILMMSWQGWWIGGDFKIPKEFL